MFIENSRVLFNYKKKRIYYESNNFFYIVKLNYY